MFHQTFIVLCVLLGLIFNIAMAFPTANQDHCFDKEYNRDLINWLISSQYPQIFNKPCNYCESKSLSRRTSKRNSELINSLLSLPKNMNDAGK